MGGQFTLKARLFTRGHTSDPPSYINHSIVVTREILIIAFLVDAYNDLDINAADIGNAYLNAHCREMIWTIAGSDFGSDKG